MKPKVIVSNSELYHELGMLKHLNQISLDKGKFNLSKIQRIINNLNKNSKRIKIIEEDNKIIIIKKNSNFDFNIYLR